tara:strand:- start:26452 stop:26628 length:177 start_codon:yes stop_codon:yes gene_type:complete
MLLCGVFGVSAVLSFIAFEPIFPKEPVFYRIILALAVAIGIFFTSDERGGRKYWKDRE